MDAVVPEEIMHELTQILSNLVLGDNKIRSSAEKAINERLAQTPELYLLGLAQFAIAVTLTNPTWHGLRSQAFEMVQQDGALGRASGTDAVEGLEDSKSIDV
ncbi:hypothetical protein C0995_015626 [Termitomyces sp. Mi166|nr:hypothetical protein C0995_015626 [Termitomyces sp. Mi166\